MRLSSQTRRVGKMALGMGALNGGLTFWSRRSEHPEESMAKSLGYAGVETAFYATMPGVAFAKDMFGVAQMVGESGIFDSKNAEGSRMQHYMSGQNWNYQDTEQAYTMRQRGMQAIQNSRMNARSVFGGEARSLHRGAL